MDIYIPPCTDPSSLPLLHKMIIRFARPEPRVEGSLAVCLYCRESSYFHTTMLCVLLGGCIRLHFNCDSEVPAVGTGSTSLPIKLKNLQRIESFGHLVQQRF